MKTMPAMTLSVSLLALVCFCGSTVQAAASPGWVTAGANPQRTSWVPDAAPGALKPIWVKPVEPYISQKVQIVAASGKLFLSTARGLYAFDAQTGADLWVYSTELPLGHSPTFDCGRVYIGGLDRKLHAIDADTGRGLWMFSAAGGFHTSPLVVGGLVYAGSRDGCMYAVDANTGKLVWQYQTGGQILQSAAYQDGVIFFGSQDACAYALNARTGTQVWRSDKLPGMGWHSWWPVIYKDVVLFTRTEVEKGLVGFQNDWLFSGNKTAKNLPGIRGTEAGDWVAGTPTVDIRTNPNGGTIPDWFERYPWRRSLIVLNRRTGKEVAFDLDNDGTTDAAPMLWAWTHGGTCYPPMVSGYDDVIYFRSVSHAVGSSIPGAVLVGWKYGTPFLSLPVSTMAGQSGFWPGDEPVGISAGGRYVYWNLCNDRFVGSADLSVANAAFPSTDGSRQWRHVSGDGYKTSTLPAGYNSQVTQYLWSVGPAKIKPMYWAHGDNVGPTIYNGRMYVHRGNAIIAFGPDGLGSSAPVLPVAPIRSGGAAPDPLSETVLRERLATEVRNILDRGHLMAGFAKIGLIDFLAVNRLGQHLLHYWHNPADMLLTLLRALPHLPPEMQEQVRQYLREEYAAFPPYKYVHIGFTDGAPREPFAYPPSTPRIFEHDSGPLTASPFPGWSKPPHNVYAMWKYAQAGLADPVTVFEQAAGVIGSIPSDSFLRAFPHVHNAYIAGYVGYVELAKMAGRPYTAQQQELDRLLRLRAQTFRWDVQADTGAAQSDQYFYTLITAWNFMYLVPELADYLRRNTLEKVQEAVDRYARMAPYWMAGHNEEVQHENGITPLYQTHALFQAKAQILQASREQLAQVLDTPIVPAGDLFYLQNLVATLEASSTSSADKLMAGPLAEAPADKLAQEVSVTINYQVPSVVSKLEIGVTHTQAMWESGHPEAAARVKKRLEEARIRYQNQHIMGWGANNPQPSPGVYDWSSLDRRLDLIRSMAHTIPVITFCTAPGWMKASGKDWNMEERVADEHVQDFADLCRVVALRYPDVEYFQIWNEFKGYWTKGGRDVERFTVLYNAVYDAVKAARPEAKIGGPYLSMGGRDLSANDRQVMDYWRQHSRGADFFAFDGWLEGWPPGGKTEDWMMGRTRFFGDLVKEFQAMTERAVWISEFYGGRSNNPQFTAANHASCYYHALQSGARLALLWDGVGLGQLFTRTGIADGGQPTPHYLVVQAFNRHFGPGTQLYQTRSSSDDIEVLASRAKIMLINKRPGAVTVRLEGKELSLEGYDVRVLDTPEVDSR